MLGCFDHISLRSHGFVLQKKSENKFGKMCNINEYLTSISDCILYHEHQVFHEHVSGMVISFDSEDDYDPDDLLDIGILVYEARGNTFEIKHRSISEAAGSIICLVVAQNSSVCHCIRVKW